MKESKRDNTCGLQCPSDKVRFIPHSAITLLQRHLRKHNKFLSLRGISSPRFITDSWSAWMIETSSSNTGVKSDRRNLNGAM